MELHARVAAYVDLNAIQENIEVMRSRLPAQTKIAAVVKADGYGHGAVPIASLLEPKDYIWGFAVATAEEAVELKNAGIQKPVLVLGYTFLDAYEDIVKYHIRPAVYRLDMAKALSEEAVRQGKTISVHVKVDTGMSRIGMADEKESIEILSQMKNLPNVELEGIFTHFAKADEADKESALKQLSRFQGFVEHCEDKGIHFLIQHCANSAAIMEIPDAALHMVRAGIASYGLYPSGEMRKDLVQLKPAMELKSHITYIKEIEPGVQVGYGGTYTADSVRRIATIPVGYGDGYPRSLSNKGYVLINGQKAPIRGRVCMDQFMVDVTEIPEAECGMEVTLFGWDHGVFLSLEELCGLSGRFNYEFICDISKRVPRVYLLKSPLLGEKC